MYRTRAIVLLLAYTATCGHLVHIPVSYYSSLYKLQSQSAFCHLTPGAENSTVSGALLLEQHPDRPLRIWGNIKGLSPGFHGFHIHEVGCTGHKCKDAGPHFNPDLNLHGGPTDTVRHAGDTGNLYADDSGVALVDFHTIPATLFPGRYNIVGRSIVIHKNLDDFGRGGNVESIKTGNAGPRLACCVITSSNTGYYL